MKRILIALSLLAIIGQAQAQKAPENWFNLSYQQDKVRGVGTERTYAELAKGRKADTVIVAVLDGGVDYNHEDLKPVMWVNRKEIAGNGIDDDKNGYVDDIHGWNFLGNKNGENVHYDQLELTRLLKPLLKKYKNKTTADVAPADQAEYARYVKMKAEFDQMTAEMTKSFDGLKNFNRALKGMKKEIREQRNVDSVMYVDFMAYTPSEKYKKLHTFLRLTSVKSQEDWVGFQEEIADGYDQLNSIVNYNLNLDFDGRSLVGDNYEDPAEIGYGNADIKGPDAKHGTHVAGIIAGVRDNGLGIKGVCGFVKIMGVRCVPGGDERDKDVANAIRYAVDNGAQIINMSFGKSYSANKSIVDDAVRYAQSKGVLLVHAAGNDSKDVDKADNFPSNDFLTGGSADNWLEIGAISWKGKKNAVASFSNYGQTQVDVFAPGVDLNSCKSNGGYLPLSGTSMAAPVCAGVAATLKAYFPSLTAVQLKSIIEQSSDRSLAKKRVIKPGEKRKKAKFKTMSHTGGVVDLYAAFQLAETMTK